VLPAILVYGQPVFGPNERAENNTSAVPYNGKAAMGDSSIPRVLMLGALTIFQILCGAQLPLRVYSTVDGLANNAVYSIASDSRGFLWYATAEGLSRFDGLGFSNQTESTGLPHRVVQQVLVGRDGYYWLATPAGLVRFRPDLAPSNPDRMVVLRPTGSPDAARISVLLEDSSGTLWCGTESGLFAIQNTAGADPRLTEIRIGLPRLVKDDSEIRGLAEDAEGAVWIGTTDGFLYRRLRDGRIERHPPPAKQFSGVTHLLSDRHGRIWVGRENSLYRSVPATHPGANGFELLSGQVGGPPHARVFDILESREGDIWVALYRSLAQFPANGAPVRLWDKDNGLPSRGVGSLGQDRDGNLWMGTGDLGALKLAAGGTLNYSRDDGIDMDAVISFGETRRGELYVAGRQETDGFRIATSSGNAFHAIAPRVPKSVSYFGWRAARVILQDHTGEWWLATSQGLCRYPRVEDPMQLAQTAPKAVYTMREGLPGTVVARIHEDSAGNIWIGSETTTMGYLDPTQERFIAIAADGVPSFSSAFLEDNGGHMWIGDEEGQLWRVRDGRAAHVPGPAKGASISAFLLDHAGRLWVATHGQGLLRFDDPTSESPQFKKYGYTEGISSLDVHSLVADRGGSIYVGTSRGIDRLNSDLTHIRRYSSADGIFSGQVIAAYCDRDGALWFGTFHGLTRMTPQTDASTDSAPVWITGVSIAGRPAPVSEIGESQVHGIEVLPGQEDIQFDFVGLSYAPGNVIRYQYRLGSDAWSAPIDSRSVHYGAIAPGSYRFMVRAITSDGQASEPPATVEFRVIPALWRRTWFQGLLVTVAVASAMWVQRVRAARLLAVERVRMRIATDLHDDIGTSLSQIAILSDVAHQRAHESNSAEPIERIGNLSRELLDSIGDIVWAIQPHRDHLSDLKQRMRRFAADMLSARNIEMHWPFSAFGQDLELNAEIRQQVYLIFKESIKNIAQHSRATEARVDLRIEDEQLILEVSDNGRGVEQGDHPNGNGLKSMRLRATRLGGELEVRTAPNKGTCVLLRISLPV
jgi:ligand-binding sensor domain-containing protein/signal transduction histidine kinase